MKLSKNIYLFTTILILFTGCQKDLDLQPLSKISDSSFWKVPSDFEKAANAFYGTLIEHSASRDNNADITVSANQNAISSGNIIVPQSSDTWDDSYETIRGATRLVENAALATEIQNDIVKYIGEARFFRAKAYFDLVSAFGDVPLIKSVLTPDSEELQAPRTPKAEVIQFILEDLDAAINSLPKESEIGSADKGRVSKGAAQALKARVCLFFGTWNKYHGGGDSNDLLSKAIQTSEDIIASGEYEIFASGDLELNYYHLFVEQGHDSKEVILSRRYNFDLQIRHRISRGPTLDLGVVPTKQLVDMFLCEDGLPIGMSPLFQGYQTRSSEFDNRDPRLTQIAFVPGYITSKQGEPWTIDPTIGGGVNHQSKSGYATRKFYSETPNAYDEGSDYASINYRLAEVLLILAEATFEKDGSISNAMLDKTINKLRDRVGMPHLSNEFVATNGLDMQTEIRRERTIELAYEGFRYDDLRRWKKANEFLPVDLLGVKYDGTEWETEQPGLGLARNAQGFVIADEGTKRVWNDRQYLFPLPIKQIQLNENLEQNPGW